MKLTNFGLAERLKATEDLNLWRFLSMKMMPTMMTVMIIVTALFMPSGLGIYWATSNLFTIVQNVMVKRSEEVNGKA